MTATDLVPAAQRRNVVPRFGVACWRGGAFSLRPTPAMDGPEFR